MTTVDIDVDEEDFEVNILKLLQIDAPEWERKGALVEELMNRFDIVTLEDTCEMVCYHKPRGIYVKGGEILLLRRLEELGGHFITNRIRSEVIASVKARTYGKREAFDKDPSMLNVKNGLLNTDTGEFRQHTPDYLSVCQLPIVYDPSAKCPRFVQFLRETLEPEHIGILVKLLGYVLLKSAIFHKAFQLTGEGSNGKSVLINTIATFLGKDNISTKALQELTGDRFAKAELYGKLANLYADIPAERLGSTGDFKMLVSGDPISAQRKYGQPFTFNNYAKMIFSANQIPKTDDKSYAYFRRWVIIPFNRTFEGDDADEHLLEKLTLPEELSGILNLALKGLKKLKDERGFKEMDLDEIRRQYEMGASRIRSFLQEQCDIEPGNEKLYEESSTLRQAYRCYCREHGTRYFDERKFGEELKALGIVHRQRRTSSKSRPYCEFGICLKGSRLTGLGKTTYPLSSRENSPIEGRVSDGSPKPTSREVAGN